MLKYERLTLGELQTNCYLVWEESSKEGVVIDPADDGEEISEIIREKGINLNGIWATHGHFDHLLGGLALKLIYNVPFLANSEDQFLLDRQKETARHFLKKEISVPNFKKIDIDLKEKDEINIGREAVKVIKTPGHTPGSVCFYYPNNWLFGGDVIFADGIGSIDHKYSSKEKMAASLETIKSLPKGILILPGHGEGFII